ncbi:uncharacterized protein LOC122992804 [Thunnus albacares]|uniref:uncharacterized protein LOC122992804 n=1 Tax=Thunnus albacares TaxID=8236 RepID=UPI001CF6D446|nr:uncharacterized protein LOC122992804 [Thunnus albacares]XP_044222686.1 uncharacterized protein LOC122992804 [Thunnus albacares]
MKRRQPPLTSSGVRRRARLSLEKRLHDIAEDCHLTSEQTVPRTDPCHSTNDTDGNNDCDSRVFPQVEDDNSDGLHTDIAWEEQVLVSESDAEAEFSDEHVSLLDSLSNWALQFSVSLVALTALLSLLRVYHPELPKDARTILKTQVNYKIQEKCGGLYHYSGILTALRNTLTRLIDNVADGFTFRLQVNIDGLPLFKSKNIQLWPILGLLLSVPMKEPVVLGLFCGGQKPNPADEFLRDFTHELQQLQEGFHFRGKKVFIKLDSVVCDTPARAFLKNTKAHNAYHGCDKCSQPGVYINRRMTFPINDYMLRTDSSFSERTDEDHHHEGPHGFSDLDIGMVIRFPLDYIHVACLGVMRRLLNIWLRGPLKFRFSSNLVDRISESLTQMCRYIPVEFARKPRSLRELDRWKATELKMTNSLVYRPCCSGTICRQ